MLDEVERGSVDIAVARLDAREQPGALVEDAAEEHHGAQHICLVDASQQAAPALRISPIGEPEAEIADALEGRPGDHLAVPRALLGLVGFVAGGEEAPGTRTG